MRGRRSSMGSVDDSSLHASASSKDARLQFSGASRPSRCRSAAAPRPWASGTRLMRRPSAFSMPSTSVRKTSRCAPSATANAPAAESAVHVQQLSRVVRARCDRRNDRHVACVRQTLDERRIRLQLTRHEPQFRVRDAPAQQATVGAGDANGVHSNVLHLRHELLVDEAREHRRRHFLGSARP